MHYLKLITLTAMSLAILLGCRGTDDTKKDLPKLVVFISLDSWRGDLPDRFQPYYTGGLKQFTDNSAWFTNSVHNHAATATGPGHLTLLSGRYHGSMGTLANNFYDKSKGQDFYCVEDAVSPLIGQAGQGASYRRVEGSSLGDWLKAAYPESKVFSVSGKDRAAVLMGGKNPDGVYWYDWDQGNFITSQYYVDEYPDYMTEFNRQKYPAGYRGVKWEKSQPESFYQKVGRAEDDYFYERDISRRTSDSEKNPEWHHPAFPHYISSGDSGISRTYYSQFGFMPYLDEVTLKLAETISEKEELGQDEIPDLLIVGISSMDIITHCVGPNGHETAELELTLDRYLDAFMQKIESMVPKSEILYVISSDHGCMDIPEMLQEQGIPAHRGGLAARAFRDSLKSAVREKFTVDEDIFLSFGMLDIYISDSILTAANIEFAELETFIREEVLKQNWVEAIYNREELADYTNLDTLGQMVAHSWHPEKGPDWHVVPKEYQYLTSLPKGTGHGQPYYYDMHVPWMIMGEGIEPQKISRRVRTIDIAPTLAEMLNLEVPDNLDGRSVLSLIER
ncbi:MAG: alkaline phosphatase family protein [Candidatus Marinimicrobia bacterium]|nr:alkaline phosphatase family protein [Candidatus Neomarinimicrobiota bacterium]MCF7840632.1 alkaline phosphatase family protein [Candidatus Neomarinimicrobiota bacterium]